MGLAASLEHRDTGSIPGLAQWVKDWSLLWLQYRLQLWLRSYPWSGNSMGLGAAKKEKVNNEKIKQGAVGVI